MNLAELIIKIMFLSRQMDQNRQRGATIQAFSLFLPTKEPCQEKRVPLTEFHVCLFLLLLLMIGTGISLISRMFFFMEIFKKRFALSNLQGLLLMGR